MPGKSSKEMLFEDHDAQITIANPAVVKTNANNVYHLRNNKSKDFHHPVVKQASASMSVKRN